MSEKTTYITQNSKISIGLMVTLITLLLGAAAWATKMQSDMSRMNVRQDTFEQSIGVLHEAMKELQDDQDDDHDLLISLDSKLDTLLQRIGAPLP